MEQGFNLNNWNYGYYTHAGNEAIISLLGIPESPEPLYTVTILDAEQNELYQNPLPSLFEACLYANERFQGIWEFKLRDEKKSGCSTCVAH